MSYHWMIIIFVKFHIAANDLSIEYDDEAFMGSPHSSTSYLSSEELIATYDGFIGFDYGDGIATEAHSDFSEFETPGAFILTIFFK